MAAETFYHAVRIDRDICRGCTACVKKCQTEAIRVREGKAEILDARCIDCGICSKVCPFHAITVEMDQLSALGDFRYNIVILPPSFYAQFRSTVVTSEIWRAMGALGFDEVFDSALSSEYVALEIAEYVKNYKGPKPIISCACPTVLRLIQVSYPELVDQVVPMLPPVEAAAFYVRREAVKRTGLAEDKIGIWFVTPCPAKRTNVYQSVDVADSCVTGCFSVSDIYSRCIQIMGHGAERVPLVRTGSSYGMGWGISGGEMACAGLENALAVSGTANVVDVFEQISLNKMPTLDYVECSACDGGCVGGALTAENRFVSEANLFQRMQSLKKAEPKDRLTALAQDMSLEDFPKSEGHVKPLEARPMMQLDDDIMEAMKKFEEMEEVMRSLPGLDCGACGAPSCRGLAEDIVRGCASEIDCIFRLRQSVKRIAKGMRDLASQLPSGGVMDEGWEDVPPGKD